MVGVVFGHAVDALFRLEDVSYVHDFPVQELSGMANLMLFIDFSTEPLRNPAMFLIMGLYARKYVEMSLRDAWSRRIMKSLRVYAIWRIAYGFFLVAGAIAVSRGAGVSDFTINPVSGFLSPSFYWFILAGAVYVLARTALGPQLFMWFSLLSIAVVLFFDLNWELESILMHALFFGLGTLRPVRLKGSLSALLVAAASTVSILHAISTGSRFETFAYLLAGFLLVLALSPMFAVSHQQSTNTRNLTITSLAFVGRETLAIFIFSPFVLNIFSVLVAPAMQSLVVRSNNVVGEITSSLFVSASLLASIGISIIAGRILAGKFPWSLGR
jgi:hypothetical protein